MRVSVNLASRPFVELRPFFARLRIIMGALAALAIGLGIWLHAEHVKLVAADAQMQALQDRTQAARQEKTRNEARMRQPANAAVLERAHFLNTVFLRKSFSWTAVMMDLETVLPSGVQVTAIEPQITAEGDVIIRLRVAGDRDRAVQLVRNLEHSHRFLAPRLTGESAQAKEATGQGVFNRPALNSATPVAPGGVEFEILANYNPVPPGEPYAGAKTSRQAGSGAGGTSHPRSRSSGSSLYPRDGVVLKPYAMPRPALGTPLRPGTPLVTPRGGAQ